MKILIALCLVVAAFAAEEMDMSEPESLDVQVNDAELEDPSYGSHYYKPMDYWRKNPWNIASLVAPTIKNKKKLAAALIRVALDCHCSRTGTRDPKKYTIKKCPKHKYSYYHKCRDFVVIIRRIVLHCSCVTSRRWIDVADLRKRYGKQIATPLYHHRYY